MALVLIGYRLKYRVPESSQLIKSIAAVFYKNGVDSGIRFGKSCQIRTSQVPDSDLIGRYWLLSWALASANLGCKSIPVWGGFLSLARYLPNNQGIELHGVP